MAKILMTGASSGFGASLFAELTLKGHIVYGVGLGGPSLEVDFLSPMWYSAKDYAKLYTAARESMGGVDILINNAGMAHCDWIEEYDIFKYQDVMKVNLDVPFMLCQEFIRDNFPVETRMNPYKSAKAIINTSSMGATIGLRGSIPYCISKSGIESMTRTLAKEAAGRYPLSVYCVAPGGIENTAMQQQVENDLVRMRGMTPEEAHKYNRQSPLGRNMTHDELVRIYMFLIENGPEYLTGTVIKCTGGMGI